MVSLLADLAICAAVIGAAWLWFQHGPSSGSNGSKSSKSKKKNKKKAGKQDLKSEEAASASDGAGSRKDVKAEPKKRELGAQKSQSANSNGRTQDKTDQHAYTRVPAEDPDFPSLSAARVPFKKGTTQPRPLAQRLAKPQRKTGVEDMLDADVEAPRTFSRTMRIVKPEPEAPMIIDDDSDHESEEENEKAVESERGPDGRRIERESAWESVPVTTQRKPPTIRIGTSSSSSSSLSTAARSVPGLPEPTKKQRQNKARAEAQKAAKEAAEQDRLQRLAAHKRGLERERMQQQQVKGRDSPRGPQAQMRAGTQRSTLSGGMTAQVSDTGALIWD